MSTYEDAPHAAAPRRTPLLARIALGLAVLAVLLVLFAGPGSRFGVWHFRTGFTLMTWGSYLAIAAFLLALVGAVQARGRRRGLGTAALALVLALVAFLPPWLFRRTAQGVPAIHDITTDTRNPPAFVSVVPLRADAPNPVEYEGETIARQQVEAYPDVRPLMLAMTPDSAFTAARQAAEEMGWEIVDTNRADGRIEASDVTPWWGFTDDVVIRVSPASGIARVDVRSKSRVGGSDVGANAARIRAYLDRLREAHGEARGE